MTSPWIIVVGFAITANGDSESSPVDIVVSAQRAAIAGLKSGRGEATIVYLKSSGQLGREISLVTRFKGTNYWMDLRYGAPLSEVPRYDRRIIINDGSGVFVNRFSKRIKPNGCEINVYENSPFGLMTGTNGFYFAPTLLAKLAVDLERCHKEFGIVATLQEDGDISGEYSQGAGYCSFLASANVGYNVTRFSAKSREAPDKNFTNIDIAWAKYGNVWCVARYDRKDYAGGKLISGASFEYRSLDPNVGIEPDSFSFDKLEPCSGVRVLDRRPEETQVHHVPKQQTDIRAEQGATLSDAVSSLPKKYPEPVHKIKDPLRRLPFWLSIAVSAVILIACLYFWQNKSTN